VEGAVARRLLLGAQGLLDDPTARTRPASLQRLVERLGFVQLDTINVVERAHHLTLHARRDGYRAEQLRTLVESRRSLFEHWTHDASVIPTRWFPHWRPRFARNRERMMQRRWWQQQFGEADGAALLQSVRDRVRREGSLRSSDFDHPKRGGGWWDWKPQKTALEYLWRTGELMIVRREGFQTVYDLTERVLPEAAALPEPSHEEHVAWACTTALERLGVASPKELAEFWYVISAAEAATWCRAAVAEGRLEPVLVKSADGSAPRPAYAPPDWRSRVARLPPPPERTRLLSPFDPIVRDRARALRRFGFDYRFEAFVPAPKRRYGYFVMPILEGDRLVGRLDPKVNRERGVLEVRGLWWEPGVKPTRARRRGLEDALARLASFVGARDVVLPR
jgi:uncharacterized protein YcaQ